MARRLARFSVLALGAAVAACTTPPRDVAMQGGADWVSINYVGDVAATLPLARQHCARYERVPVLRQAKDETAVYACVRG